MFDTLCDRLGHVKKRASHLAYFKVSTTKPCATYHPVTKKLSQPILFYVHILFISRHSNWPWVHILSYMQLGIYFAGFKFTVYEDDEDPSVYRLFKAQKLAKSHSRTEHLSY